MGPLYRLCSDGVEDHETGDEAELTHVLDAERPHADHAVARAALVLRGAKPADLP